MKMSLIISASAIVVLLAGCAATYTPLVDYKAAGFNASQYGTDLFDCRQFSQQVAGPGAGAAGGAVAGALVGTLLSRLAGGQNNGQNARVGAGVGALSGAAGGGQNEVAVVRKCMQGRGYSVLN